MRRGSTAASTGCGNQKPNDEELDGKIVRLENPLECTIIERINRFVVKITVDGKPYKAYINNTGRLLEYLIRGKKGFCTRTKGKGKTDFRLFSIEESGLGAIIDTQLQMRAFEKTSEMKLIPWLKGCRILKRNAKLGRSLIDYLLECGGEKVYLEVKSAVLKMGEYAMYPDCPSSRGRKHIKDLTDYAKKGGSGIILFIAALPGVKAFKPNRSADPELYGSLLEAYKSGVDIRSIGLYYNPEDSFIHLSSPNLEVSLF